MVHLHHLHHHIHRSNDSRQASPKKPKIPEDINNPPFYLPLRSFSNRYRVISNLGNGSFGNVSLAKINVDLNDSSNFKAFKNTLLERSGEFVYENSDNKRTGIVAIKTMNKRLATLNDYTRVKEIRFILSIPYHKNLVQVYEMFIDNVDFKLHIVMECLDQNLYQLMKARKNNYFSQGTLKSILSQILNGIRHIHRNDYFHRDVKPENILVSPSNVFYSQDYLQSDLFMYHDNFIVKIADYGLARHVDNRRPYTSYVSTRWYRAPEILLRRNWYSRPVDIWAFGSVATEVVTFRPLFPGSNELEQTWKVLEVLGTPISGNNLDNYYPSYGYWDEAQFLSNQLGLSFPQRKCMDIDQIISNPELRPLCDVIRACLAWNPATRADIEKICNMPYFRNTCVDDQIIGSTSSSKTRATFSPTILEKSERLAGIPPLKRQPLQNETPTPTYGSSPQEICEVNLSFLNDSEPNYYKLNGIDYTYERTFDDQFPPNLTQESLQTNDENLNSTSFNHHISLNQMPLKQSFPHAQNVNASSIQSFVDYNNYGFNNSNYKSLYEKNSSPDQYFGLTCPNNENLGSRNVESSEFIDWSKFDSENTYNNPNQAFLNADQFTNKIQLNGTTDDSIMGLYEKEFSSKKEASVPGLASDGLENEKYNFSDELYSKFTLRRLNVNDDTASTTNDYLVDCGDSFEATY